MTGARSIVRPIGWVVSLVVGGVLLAVYALTLAPTITWAHHGADGGDLVMAVAQGSIPHPPGFPTYLLLGNLFIRLPWGDPAWRLNLMSAVLAAGAAVLMGVAVTRLPICGTGKEEANHPAARDSRLAVLTLPFAVCTGLGLGLSPLFWSQAVIAEVYAPAAFFAALVALIALHGKSVWALGLAWGVGMGAHLTLFFLAPLVVWGAWGEGREGRWRRVVQVGLLAFLSGGVLYGPVLLGRGDVPSPWADVSTLGGWWAFVSGRIYRGYLFGLPLLAWPRRLLAWAGLLARQFTPLGAILAGLGWIYLWQEQRTLSAVSAMTFGLFSFGAISYDTADSLVYLVPALPLAALWLGTGCARTVTWLNQRLEWSVWLVLLLPLLQALVSWEQVDLSGDYAAMEWAEQVLKQAPPRAVVFTDQDQYTFTLWYAHDVLGRRPDVVVIDEDLWAHVPYRNLVSGDLGLQEFEIDLLPEAAAHRAARPVVKISKDW